jgi:hypothetical protein
MENLSYFRCFVAEEKQQYRQQVLYSILFSKYSGQVVDNIGQGCSHVLRSIGDEPLKDREYPTQHYIFGQVLAQQRHAS